MRGHLQRVRARVQPVAVQVSDSLVAAMERAHRQHTAQRMLGTRGAAPQRRTRRWVWALALAALAGLLWFWWAHNRAARPAADPATD
jgi:hypothetical protein